MDFSTVKISQNTEKSPADPRRLAVTQPPVNDHQLTLVSKTRKELCSNNETDTIRQAEMEEKRTWEERENFRKRNSHPRNKHQGSLFCGIFKTILQMDKGRTLTNGPNDKEIYDYAQGFTSERWHSQTICIKSRRRKRTRQWKPTK